MDNQRSFQDILKVLLAILPLVSLPAQAFAQKDAYGFSKTPLTRTYDTDDYFGGIQNWDFTQSEQGYLYVANNFGLLEFDGSKWEHFTVTNNTRVRSVYADTDGRIYIGGQNQFGYFKSDKTGGLEFCSLYDSLPKEESNLEDIWKIIKHDKKIYFSSYLGTIVYDGKTVEKLATQKSCKSLFKVGASLYAQSEDNSLYQITSDGQVSQEFGDMIFSDEIIDIIPLNNNSILIFQKNGGLYRLRNNELKKWFPTISEFLEKAVVNKVLLLRNQNIAIGTQNNGVVIISQEGKVVHHLSNDKGLENRTTLTLHEDQFENLWVGLNNGLAKVELSSPFSIINEESELPGTGYSATFNDNRLYLGTSNGLFYQESNHDPLSMNAGYELIKRSGGQVYSIQNINDHLLMGHHKGGFEIKNNQANLLYGDFGVWGFLNVPNHPSVIAGTYRGFASLTYQNESPASQQLDGFQESSRVFQFANDSTLFMTHGYKGIYKINFNSDKSQIKHVDFYGIDKGLPSNILINVFNIGGNELIFAAKEGIYRYDEASDRFTRHEAMEALFGERVHLRAIAYDLTGNIYFITNDDVGYLELTDRGEYIKHSDIFSRIERYISDDLENVTVIDHENVLFGAKEGFIHFNPSVSISDDELFNTYIRTVSTTTQKEEKIFKGNGDISKISLKLPASFSSIKFRFASPYFNNEGQLRYQYQLQNFDQDWSEWTSLTEKEYTNLSAGDYTFHVRATNHFGQVSSEDRFSFEVFPPWYRSTLAYTVYGLLFFLIFGAYMFFLDRKFRLEKKSLNIQQKRELIKKDNEIVLASRKSEAEITKLRNDKLRSEIDHKNRELATTTMHLITKNEFMLKIRDVLKENAKAGNKDQFKRIIRDIDRNMSEDEGWEQFTKHFDQVHGQFLNLIKKDNPALTPQEIKLCAYLRMNMSSKEIANLLNISVRGVEIGRYRLRKKLGISRDTNLIDYMLKYS